MALQTYAEENRSPEQQSTTNHANTEAEGKKKNIAIQVHLKAEENNCRGYIAPFSLAE